jgi:DNA/RNA endonuclease G (NUC1)
MIKRIIYIVATLTLLSNATYAQDTIRTRLYEIVYSQALEQPLHIEYVVKCPFGKAERYGMSFFKPDSIHTSDNADYEDNIWDKGHMVPASSFSCSRDTLYQTFNYVNCALQHQSLNRGVWARLEQFEKNLAKFYKVNVKIDVLFRGKPNRLTTGAVVPTGFKKTIMFDDMTVEFYFPNEDTSGKDWHEFIINE